MRDHKESKMEHEIERRTEERLRHSLHNHSHQFQGDLTQSSMIGSPNTINNMEGALAELSLDYTNRTRKQIRSNKMMNE